MGGHHTIKLPEVPDYKIYKVEDVPQLMAVRQALAAQGLTDPWLRNEVWQYTEVKNKYPLSSTLKYLVTRGLKAGVIIGVIAAALDYAFLDHYSGHEHFEEHGKHN